MKNKLIKRVIIGISLCVFFFFIGGPCVYVAVILNMKRAATKKKVLLLYKTDHKALLHACRELYKEGYRGEFNLDDNVHPDVKKFPEIILALDPAQVLINDDRVNIGMMRGIVAFGVSAYHEHFIKPFKGYNIGDKKLLDGLWYYDIGYKPGYEREYEKYLQSLKPK